jgi:hypothetical protein
MVPSQYVLGVLCDFNHRPHKIGIDIAWKLIRIPHQDLVRAFNDAKSLFELVEGARPFVGFTRFRTQAIDCIRHPTIPIVQSVSPDQGAARQLKKHNNSAQIALCGMSFRAMSISP